MKTVKIKFVGFWKNFVPEESLFYKTLKKHYDVQITDDADYIICSMFGKEYQYCKYPQIRIMISGENYIPDYNLIDYSIATYPVHLQDRNLYFPCCVDCYGHCESLESKNRNYSDDILKSKIYFANFIAGHESENNIRGDFFKRLCKYKRVESPGKYLNNMPDGETVEWYNSSKTDFQRKCKFTLCFESTKHEGFVTEKITDAFFADTIPVYYGSSNVTDIFNSKAFINCSDYPDMEAVIQKIIELDSDDDKYMKMLRQPIFVDSNYYSNLMKAQEKFLLNIFEQPYEKAYRRSRVFISKNYNNYLSNVILPSDIETSRAVSIKMLLSALRVKIKNKLLGKKQ